MSVALTAPQQVALGQLRESHPALRVVLVGAAALQCHLELSRPTYDIDLAVVVEPDLMHLHLQALGWRQSPRMSYRWQHANGTWLDVIPATPALLARGSVNLDGAELTLLGFDLVLAHAEQRDLAAGTRLEVASLPTLAILKVVSWLDRPYERTKDLADLSCMLEQALRVDDQRRWEPPLTASPFEEQAAHFLGSEVARIARVEHREVLRAFLERMHASDGVALALLYRAARASREADEERIGRQLATFERALRTS